MVGGETAEMPGFYPEDEYDLAGFSVGIIDKKNIINSQDINVGDKVIGLASSGVHSNGFSLIRKVFNINGVGVGLPDDPLNKHIEELSITLGEKLLTPTKIYVKPILKLLEQVKVKGISHVTGGGFYENLPRMLREGVSINIDKASYKVPEIFKLIQKTGSIPERDMYNTFNMGIGMAVIVAAQNVEETLSILKVQGEEAYLIGEVVEGEREVNIL